MITDECNLPSAMKISLISLQKVLIGNVVGYKSQKTTFEPTTL